MSDDLRISRIGNVIHTRKATLGLPVPQPCSLVALLVVSGGGSHMDEVDSEDAARAWNK